MGSDQFTEFPDLEKIPAMEDLWKTVTPESLGRTTRPTDIPTSPMRQSYEGTIDRPFGRPGSTEEIASRAETGVPQISQLRRASREYLINAIRNRQYVHGTEEQYAAMLRNLNAEQARRDIAVRDARMQSVRGAQSAQQRQMRGQLSTGGLSMGGIGMMDRPLTQQQRLQRSYARDASPMSQRNLYHPGARRDIDEAQRHDMLRRQAYGQILSPTEARRQRELYERRDIAGYNVLPVNRFSQMTGTIELGEDGRPTVVGRRDVSLESMKTVGQGLRSKPERVLQAFDKAKSQGEEAKLDSLYEAYKQSRHYNLTDDEIWARFGDDIRHYAGNEEHVFAYKKDKYQGWKTPLTGFDPFKTIDEWKKARDEWRKLQGVEYHSEGGIVGTGTFNVSNPSPSFFKPRGTDTVPAMLSDGEFVVNARATQSNLGVLSHINSGGSLSSYAAKGGPIYRSQGGMVGYYQHGGFTSTTPTIDWSDPLDSMRGIFDKAVDGFKEFGNKFTSAASGLTSAMNNLAQMRIPDTIEMQARHDIHVNLNGAAVLAAMEDKLKDICVAAIGEQLKVHMSNHPHANPNSQHTNVV